MLCENEYGFSCVAAPIFSYEGIVEHAISLTMTTAKLQANPIETFAMPLQKAALAISQKLGYDIPG